MRRILYGYQILNGELAVQPQEAKGVKRLFSYYLLGLAQQRVADALNEEGFRYSSESPAWSKDRVERALKNSCYMGEKGYPVLINSEIFRMAQDERSERANKWGDHPALCLTKMLRCGECGGTLRRIAEQQWKYTLRFHCDQCGISVTIPDANLLSEIERQAAEYEPTMTDSVPYTPSEDVVRLTNAINRGLERPEHPEDVAGLILQGISARYACFPTQMTSTDILRLIKEKDFNQAVRYITISADNVVTVAFK